MPCLAIRGDERTDCSVFNKLGNARHDQLDRCRLMPMAMPQRLFIFWERFENAFRDNVFDADQARVGRVPIIDDALDELLGEVVAEVVRLDLSPHIVSIEMEPVQIHIDRTKPQWEFPRLCRGGSKSLTYPAVDTAAPSTKLRIASRQAHEEGFLVALGPRVIKRRLCSRGNLERTVMVRPIPASSILDALPGEVSRGLFAHGRSVSLEAEQTLFLAGDEGDGCYRVEDGLLKASVTAPNAGERILAILGPGSVVGELSMID